MKSFLKNSLFAKLFFSLLGVSLIPAVLFLTFIGIFVYFSFSSSLTALTNRIDTLLVNPDGSWNISQYNADEQTPHPHGSSGFPDPLYIFSTSGYVIERNRPIPGYLDLADFEKVGVYDTASTVQSETGENWRILSRPVTLTSGTRAVILVSVLDPDSVDQSILDRNLEDALDYIGERVTEVPEASVRIEPSEIPYNIAYEVITERNIVLSNNGRIPTFIDPSYVERLLQGGQRTYFEHSTGAFEYVVRIHPLVRDGRSVGVVVIGKSLQPLLSIVMSSFLWYLGVMIAIGIILSLRATYYLRSHRRSPFWMLFEGSDSPQRIKFRTKEGMLTVDSTPIPIPPGTLQHALCTKLFVDPSRVWTVDELTKLIPDELLSTRRSLYDSILLINKKSGIKLIEYKDRNILLNPDLGL